MVTGYDPVDSIEMMNAEAARCVIEQRPLHFSDEDVKLGDLVAAQPEKPLVDIPQSRIDRELMLIDVLTIVTLFTPLILWFWGIRP